MDNLDTGSISTPIVLTAEIVASYVTHNAVQKGDIASLIAAVHGAVSTLGQEAPAADTARPVPLVSIKKSIGDDYLISLEDGRRYKSLKRHLSGHGLSPEQYRQKWSLPHDYPMVAPSYARQRSELAKSMGLGRKRAEPVPVAPKRGRRAAGAQG